ncbi:MAG: pantoate--beta-alanine ligase [Terrimicrobiaceae bacterium]
MIIKKSIPGVRSVLAKAGHPRVLVPTMGGLHRGHRALINKARRVAGDSGTVIVSIFVNPTQFGPTEDFSKYPRPFRQDSALCEAAGADVLFAPEASRMYLPEFSVSVMEESLSQTLCGLSRPGHFRGVGTVVAKLFHILQPDIAIFGEKDWQQLAILNKMVRDLNFPVKMLAHPTVREPDGLALSSRNVYLSSQEREAAPSIYEILKNAASLTSSPGQLTRKAREQLQKVPGARLDYLELVDAETLQAAKDRKRPARLATAVFFGKTRLIDNVPVPKLSPRQKKLKS